MSDLYILKQTISDLFLGQAAQRPEEVAVSDDQADLTYGQLSRLVSGVTRAVIEKTAGDEARVCILAPHRISAVAGMLGVLQAGGCFIPMLPQEDDAYLRYLFENSEASLVVCDPEFTDRAVSICKDEDCVVAVSDGLPRHGPSRFQEHRKPGDISAIMYTSGSTGQPKGVITTEEAILHRALQHVEMAEVTSLDRQASVIPWQFAASFPDVFAPLLTGAGLYLYDNHQLGVDRLGPWLQKNQVTLLKLSSALVRRFIETVSAGLLNTVRHVYVGGGAIRTADARALLALLPEKAVLMHGFGSTETNLLAVMHWRTGDPALQNLSAKVDLPVGYPVPGKKIQIVDNEGNPVPPGGEGELVAVGRDLFRGYWGLPQMTAQYLKELPNGECVYRTGDLARIREDGCLEILGRKGSRIKIRGLRIDLEAVASLLRSLPYVRDAVAVSVASQGKDARLIAYLETTKDDPVSITNLREDMKKIVPGYMIPSRFVTMDALPRTASGKIDRSLLPSPGHKRPAMTNPYEAPRTPLESRLADIWSEVLDIEKIGVHDDFLELGGDSLLALELETRLQHEPDIGGRVDRLLQASTVARMAEIVEFPDAMPRLSTSTKIPFHWRLVYFRRNITNGRINVPAWMAHLLPSYELFLRLQKKWICSSLAQFYLKREIHAFKQWLSLTSQSDDQGNLMRQNLMANSWYVVRNFLLTRQNTYEAWVRTAGWDHVRNVAAAGKGALLVFPHTRVFFSYIRDRLTENIFPESFFLGVGKLPPNGANRTVLLVDRLREAGRVIARGGAVWVAGDGYNGTVRVVVTKYGRRFPFRSGAAELAVNTGAPLLPVFPALRPDGGIEVLCLPPLAPSRKGSLKAQTEALLRQYAEMYVDFWPKILPSMGAGRQINRLRDLAEAVPGKTE